MKRRSRELSSQMAAKTVLSMSWNISFLKCNSKNLEASSFNKIKWIGFYRLIIKAAFLQNAGYVSVKPKLQHPPSGHTPGIWQLCCPGEEGIWFSESSRGWGIWSPCVRGGEFELQPRFHVKSLVWRAVMGDPGGALGYFLGGGMCRPGLQIGTPF